MGRCTKAVKAKSACPSSEAQRTVADQPSTEKRCRLLIGIAIRNWKTEALGGDCVPRLAPVECVASEAGAITQVLAPALAESTFTACPAEPRHTDALPDLVALGTGPLLNHFPDDLVSED